LVTSEGREIGEKWEGIVIFRERSWHVRREARFGYGPDVSGKIL